MITATGLRWILTALFALPTLYALLLAATPGRTIANRVGHALHAAMGGLMVAMAWPWGMSLPADPQIVVFTAGALWFAIAALARSSETDSRTAGLVAALPHIVMMAAMAWMVAVMDGSAMASGAHGSAADMPGMDMSGPGAAGAMTLSRAGDQWTAGLLAVALAGLGLLWLSQAFDRGRITTPTVRGPASLTAALTGSEAAGPACHAAMAIGMAVMFVLLL
ncbi:DUF5134 domain-containing protein [Streptomyces sp. NPDC091267]|uniref:DUF5134 domain-containing protein n=1 Tax=Streptomyces sp. NPDC091267 TaxID=3155195 RepID=UPI00343D5A61